MHLERLTPSKVLLSFMKMAYYSSANRLSIILHYRNNDYRNAVRNSVRTS